MPSKAQKKNAWRTRRREVVRNEARSCIDAGSIETACLKNRKELVAWALSVIEYYCKLWEFAKASPFVTKHKQKLIKDLFTLGNYRGIFDNWTKANGLICYNIQGYHKDFISARGAWKETSMVKYDFWDETTYGRYVLTTSGSLYALHDHRTKGTSEEFSIREEKTSDLIKFRVIYGPPPRRPC